MAGQAVGIDRISRVVGYQLTKGDFRSSSPNLPIRIAVIGESNSANQVGLTIDPVKITSAQQAGTLFGFGSPIHQAMRILRPSNSDGVGAIETIVYPQLEPGGSVARVATLTTTGTSTGNTTHTVLISGRRGIDGQSYDYQVETGDTDAEISQKQADAINAVVGCPYIATVVADVLTLTAKWKGETAQDATISFDYNGNSSGLTYVVAETVAGSGSPTVTASLEKFGNQWNNLVLNCYRPSQTGILDELEDFNGIPDPINPTGRYNPIIWKPFIALTGSVDEENTALTDARKNEVTIALCPAPLSDGTPLEAAANYCLLTAKRAQETPNLGVSGLTLNDMPAPVTEEIGGMSVYNNRDVYVKQGNSTADIISGVYRIQDFVTTYHPVGEIVPAYRYPRDLLLDFNVRYTVLLLEEANVLDHQIANDDDEVDAANVVKPKMWKAVLSDMFDSLVRRGLIVDAAFSKESLTVHISSSNPNRFETFFRYKRSGTVLISSTVAEAGFNFGN